MPGIESLHAMVTNVFRRGKPEAFCDPGLLHKVQTILVETFYRSNVFADGIRHRNLASARGGTVQVHSTGSAHPDPYFISVMFIRSRRTHKSSIVGSASTVSRGHLS
jgi:hypothetical protein